MEWVPGDAKLIAYTTRRTFGVAVYRSMVAFFTPSTHTSALPRLGPVVLTHARSVAFGTVTLARLPAAEAYRALPPKNEDRLWSDHEPVYTTLGVPPFSWIARILAVEFSAAGLPRLSLAPARNVWIAGPLTTVVVTAVERRPASCTSSKGPLPTLCWRK